MNYQPGTHEIVIDDQTIDLLMHSKEGSENGVWYRRVRGMWYAGEDSCVMTHRWVGLRWVAMGEQRVFRTFASVDFPHDLTADIASGMSWSEAVAKPRACIDIDAERRREKERLMGGIL